MEITERQQNILRAVVEDYISTAMPVPSERIAGRSGLKVSSATVRNELVELELLGLLTHPHTSAGRIPTDLGYRYYVEHLMSEVSLSPTEQYTIWHQFHQVEDEVDQWGPLAAAVMAQTSRLAAVATKLHAMDERIKRVELVSVQDDLVLVVLVLQSGGVEQRMLRTDRPVGRDDLIKTGNRLSDQLVGMTARQVARESARLSGLNQDVAHLAARLMEQSERYWGDDIYYEGIGFVSSEPEFGRSDRLLELVEALHRGAPLVPLLSEALETGDLRVIVGDESDTRRMRGCSVVLKRYGRQGEAAGVVGVVGPTRMRYWRAVSLVRFVADLLDRLVDQSLRQRR